MFSSHGGHLTHAMYHHGELVNGQKDGTMTNLPVMLNCVFVTFLCAILGQVWYLIVTISDLCHLSYFNWDESLDTYLQSKIKCWLDANT